MKQVMVKRWCLVAAWAVLALISQSVDAEALCNAAISETANDELFEEGRAGEIHHLPSKLVFMRCALGQQFEGGECIGQANRYTWQEALHQSLGFSYNDDISWRLPNVKELSVIVERACVRPSINETSFPNTPDDEFWSATPSILDGQRAWSVAFFNGTSSIKAKDRTLHVRLVRNRRPNE